MPHTTRSTPLSVFLSTTRPIRCGASSLPVRASPLRALSPSFAAMASAQLKRPPCFHPPQLSCHSPLIPSSIPLTSTTGILHSPASSITCLALSIHCYKPRPQHLVPSHYLLHAPSQCFYIQLSFQSHPSRHVVCRSSGLQLIINHSRCCAYDNGSSPSGSLASLPALFLSLPSASPALPLLPFLLPSASQTTLAPQALLPAPASLATPPVSLTANASQLEEVLLCSTLSRFSTSSQIPAISSSTGVRGPFHYSPSLALLQAPEAPYDLSGG